MLAQILKGEFQKYDVKEKKMEKKERKNEQRKTNKVAKIIVCFPTFLLVFLEISS